MSLIEFLLSVAVVGMVVLQCVILIELRDSRHTRDVRGSPRRKWQRTWIRGECDRGE